MNYKGIVKLNGVNTHNIEVTVELMNSQYISNFYFDLHSSLLIGQRKLMPIHAVGENVDIIVHLSDYRNVANTLMPFSFIERYEKDGKFLNATIWSEFIVNTDIPSETFDPPNEGQLSSIQAK